MRGSCPALNQYLWRLNMEEWLTVTWMNGVCLMWTPMKSSNLDFAPGIASPEMEGLLMRHFTASVYAIFSSSLRDSHSFRTAAVALLQLEYEPREA